MGCPVVTISSSAVVIGKNGILMSGLLRAPESRLTRLGQRALTAGPCRTVRCRGLWRLCIAVLARPPICKPVITVLRDDACCEYRDFPRSIESMCNDLQCHFKTLRSRFLREIRAVFDGSQEFSGRRGRMFKSCRPDI